MDYSQKNELKVDAGLVAGGGLRTQIVLENHYKIECIRDGKVIWVEEIDNLVVTEGLNDSLDKHLKGSAYTAAWYVGLTNTTPTFAAADTMASHAGWTENTTYDEANRQTLTLGTVSAGSVSNTASKAVFTIAGTVTIGGAFVTSVNTKGGTTGILYGGGALSQNRSLVDNDVLNITITCTAAAA